jgi:hypothetical protein
MKAELGSGSGYLFQENPALPADSDDEEWMDCCHGNLAWPASESEVRVTEGRVSDTSNGFSASPHLL